MNNRNWMWFFVQVVLSGLLTVPLAAQQSSPTGTEGQREAMKKLAFLVGHWTGPVTIARGPGEPLRLTQTENVEYKLDGLVLLIQGQSAGADGKAQFQALATIAYDEASGSYRFRAYNAGHYVDTELALEPAGFSWRYNAGTAKVQNIMHLTSNGDWQETADLTFGSNPPRRSVEMLLARQR
ncbi:MAG TPA: hypothetical protein VKB38_22675 [Terracidiphilus sp.]|nr:hypothetical protein [Terracidiphilus sp.]